VDATQLLPYLRSDGEALAAAGRAALDAQVPSCPDWNVGQLVQHTGHVHRWVTEIVRTQSMEPVPFDIIPEAPKGPAVVDWYAEGVDGLVTAMEKAGADTPMWNWSGTDFVSSWWIRRMGLETAIHRWDGQNAVSPGNADAIAPLVGVAGVDEMFEIFLPDFLSEQPDIGIDGTLHLHATDTEGEWSVDLRDGTLTKSHGKADAAVRGPAGDLYLLLWNRIPASDLEVFGEEGILADWQEKFRI
jgi:uncharacterized protein (TIGR03083 family)